MASIMVHPKDNAPYEVRVKDLARGGDALYSLYVDQLGGDSVTFFFDSPESLKQFANDVQNSVNGVYAPYAAAKA